MNIPFKKYQATGNDFIIIDNRSGNLSVSVEQVKAMCDRRLGIGADGLMLIEKHPFLDFNLVYYNSDGSQSLCGNGTRAAVKLASSLGMVNGKASFQAYDGPHEAELLNNGIVKVKMNDVKEWKKTGDNWHFYTGSPHLIRIVEDVENFPVFDEGRKIRYSDEFKPGGVNANFVELRDNNAIYVRTYERGVEDETLSCGTGVTAAALATSFLDYSSPVEIKTKGGDLSVEFKANPSGFTEIYLIGPAKMVFEGQWVH